MKRSSVVPRCRRADVTVSLAAQRGRLALHHEHQRLGDGGPGHRGGLETSLNDHLHLGLGRALVVASRAHVRATVFRSRRQDLHRETAMARMHRFEQKKKKKTPHTDTVTSPANTCMTALDSMGTGLLSMVLRLLSSLCQDTDGRGSPEA